MYNININTEKPLAPKWYSPYTKWPISKRNWIRLNSCYSFDREKLFAEVLKIKEAFQFKPFPLTKNKKMITYRGICLTAKKNSSDPLYEGLKIFNKNGELDLFDTVKKCQAGQPPELYEKDFVQKTEIYNKAKYIDKVLNRFNLPFSKIRILELKKGGLVVPHVDFPYYKYIRIHTVLQTNEKTFWSSGGETFQIPADGYWYWFDVGKAHSVWNYGKTDRIVLSLNLSLYEDANGNAINQERPFEEFISSGDL